MSLVRVLALLALGLLLLTLASGRVPNSHAFAVFTGQCLRKPAPSVCRPPPPPPGRDI